MEERVSDDPKKRGRPDRTRIATRQPHELRRWAKVLGVPQYVLVLAHEALWASQRANTVANFRNLIADVKELAADARKSWRAQERKRARKAVR